MEEPIDYIKEIERLIEISIENSSNDLEEKLEEKDDLINTLKDNCQFLVQHIEHHLSEAKNALDKFKKDNSIQNT